MQQQPATSTGEDEREQPAARCRNCGSPWHGSSTCVLAAGSSTCSCHPAAGPRCPSCGGSLEDHLSPPPTGCPATATGIRQDGVGAVPVPAAGPGDPAPENQPLLPGAGSRETGCAPDCPCGRWRGGARLDDELVAVAPVSGGSSGNAWPAARPAARLDDELATADARTVRQATGPCDCDRCRG